MSETEEEERNSEHDANNVTMDNFCQSPVATNMQGNIVNFPNEKQKIWDILAEEIKNLKN